MKTINFLGVMASIITIVVFLANVLPDVEPSSTPPVYSDIESRQSWPISREAPPSLWDRFELLAQSATGLAKIAVSSAIFVTKLAVVLFTPWIPASIIYRYSFGSRMRRYGFLWRSPWDERVPVILSSVLYLVIGAIALAIIFPSFLVSKWIWGSILFWAEYNSA